MPQLIAFYFNGSPISGWSIGISSSQSAEQLLTSGPRFCVSPAQPFCSFSLFSSFILLSCLHLKSSSVLINTVSLVINNYVKGSKRCHLLERDCMYTTKWHAHLNYLKKRRNINNAPNSSDVTLVEQRKERTIWWVPTTLHIWSHLKRPTTWVVGMMAILKGEETKAQKISNHLQEFTKLIDDIAGMIWNQMGFLPKPRRFFPWYHIARSPGWGED